MEVQSPIPHSRSDIPFSQTLSRSASIADQGDLLRCRRRASHTELRRDVHHFANGFHCFFDEPVSGDLATGDSRNLIAASE